MSYSGSYATTTNGRSRSRSRHRRDDYRRDDYRSRSPPRYYNNSYAHKSSNDYGHDSRAQALSQQLASAQSEVMRLETDLSNSNRANAYAEHKVITLQQDVNSLKQKNNEVIEVMKTLETGIEALQKERDDLKAKLELSEKNSATLNEQVLYLNERNSTLAKKCVDLLDGSKDSREKVIEYEEELKRIKPRFEQMEASYGALSEQNKNYANRLNMFETRERIWIREKNELEERQKKDLEHWQKVVAEMRTKHEMEMNRLRTQQQQQIPNNTNIPTSSAGPSKADVGKMEQHIKELHQLLESIQRYHKSELAQYQRKLDDLEKQCSGSGNQIPNKSQDTGDDDKKLSNSECEQLTKRMERDSPDDDIILLDAGPSNAESESASPIKEGREKKEINAG